MSWQTAILLQVLVSSCMTILTRQITLSTKRVFFGVGLVSYITIGLAGFVYTLIALRGVAGLPSFGAWLFIVAEGFCIPASWLVLYQIIKHSGAGNAVIASAAYTVSAATLSIIVLNDTLSAGFVAGATLIIISSLLSLRIRPDIDHPNDMSVRTKALLLGAGALLFAVGMLAEKKAISSIGVWHYTMYGWGMQAIGAAVLFSIFGRSEFPHMTRSVIRKGALLGVITSVAGGLYVYALSLGELSRTVVATSGKVAITLVLAAIILRERNALWLRLAAFALSVSGLALIV
jgi:drug/metabolite transporter (DMT)-like permease